MWHPLDFWGWWMMPGWIWMIVFWGLIVWGVVTLIDRLGRNDSHPPKSNAMAILEERFARGEITREEFEDMRQTLRT